MSKAEEKEHPRGSTVKRELKCSACFDALWFCYSPVRQMQQYYRVGVLDNCSKQWKAMFDCLNLKTKRESEVQEILEARESSKPHIWTFRTPEEASERWNKIYGHLLDENDDWTQIVQIKISFNLASDSETEYAFKYQEKLCFD